MSNHNIVIKYVDDPIPFSRRHAGETIREIIRYDSGYLKDLFLKDERLCFSEECFKEICRLTKGHKDNWETPNKPGMSIFSTLKPYKGAYLFDFNEEQIRLLHQERLKMKKI